MKAIQDTLRNMGTLSDNDKECISQGFDSGNYANAYETEDYDEACTQISGANGFYRVGHMLGFFSSYEIGEIPMHLQDEVNHYRAVMAHLGIEL